MDNNTKYKSLTAEQLFERDHQFVEKIISDDEFAYYFFHEKCYRLFCKIQWTIFGNDADYDEIINSFYEYLKRPDDSGEYWHKLKTFDYRTSLFDWIKTVAVRFFYEPCKEKLFVPNDIVESGIFETIISELKSPEARKYFWFLYVQKFSSSELCSHLNVDKSQLRLLARRSETALRKLVKQKFSEYYDRLFYKDNVELISVDNVQDLPVVDDHSKTVLSCDLHSLVDRMPNQRYKIIIEELFFKDVTPEELALKMNIKVSNVYNLKSRAIEQLRDILLFSPGEIDVKKYINLIDDDRLKIIAHSIFDKQMEYDAIIENLGLTNEEFKKLKHTAMRKLKMLIFN